VAPLLATGTAYSFQDGFLCGLYRGLGAYIISVPSDSAVAARGTENEKRTSDGDGVILAPDKDAGTRHFVQACDVGALGSDDAREAGAIRKREEPDVSRRLCLFDRFRHRVLGLVDARLVAGLQSPGRLALLGVGVIRDDLPMSLGDGVFGIIDARRRRGRGARRTDGGDRGFSGLYGGRARLPRREGEGCGKSPAGTSQRRDISAGPRWCPLRCPAEWRW
jgi:hypothetical protein